MIVVALVAVAARAVSGSPTASLFGVMEIEYCGVAPLFTVVPTPVGAAAFVDVALALVLSTVVPFGSALLTCTVYVSVWLEPAVSVPMFWLTEPVLNVPPLCQFVFAGMASLTTTP